MRIQYKIKQAYLHFMVSILCLFSVHISANEHVKFDDVVSTVMLNSLQPLSKDNFLRQFYGQFLFVPLWIQEEHPSALANSLFEEVLSDETLLRQSKLKQDALDLKGKINKLYTSYSTLKQKISMEFKISLFYRRYANYTLYGSINWGAFQSRLYNLRKDDVKAAWVTYKPDYTPISLLEKAAMTGNLAHVFHEAKPDEYHYDALEHALYRYKDMAKQGGWLKLSFKGTLKPGKSYKIVPMLRERLRKSEDYEECGAPESKLYDECLKASVVRFQRRHGLVANGSVNQRTRKALNVSVERRIKEIRLNLDRIKWLHQRHAKRHIIINIPAFTLFFEENDTIIEKMRVITGRKKNPTPIFSNTVQTIVLNPYWNLPKSIIQKEMIPKLLKNPKAMTKKGIEIHKGWGANAVKINPKSIDWAAYRYSKKMPFHFAQKPGYKNALGKVKFLFPNQFSVYMHDTPNKKLFKRNVRAFSHGCIRLQKPRELLKTFSAFNDSVDFKKSTKRLKGKKEVSLKLDSQVPVDVVYLTAYVDYNGVLNFRNDIYGYDKMQLQSYRKW